MPHVPDASSVTRLRAVQSSAVSDPVKRSASYVPAQPALLYSLRATDAGRGMFPGQTALSNPVTCGYVNPRHSGYVTGPAAPLSAVYTYKTGLDEETLPASGEVGIGNSDPLNTLFLSTNDRNGLLSTAFLDALFSATTITLTSGGKVEVYTNSFTDITKTASYYRVGIPQTTPPFEDDDVVTITYA